MSLPSTHSTSPVLFPSRGDTDLAEHHGLYDFGQNVSLCVHWVDAKPSEEQECHNIDMENRQ